MSGSGGRRRVALTPGGSPIGLGALARTLASSDPAARLTGTLEALLGSRRIDFYASGREALRALLLHLASTSGRQEVIVPGYTCFSVPAAVVAAGLRVRLVDVTPEGRIDPASLAGLPLERAAAAVVSNLFGVPETLGPLRKVVAGSGVALVDDVAQVLGGRASDGPAGARGEIALLSFGRGKPLAALGGGAVAWTDAGEPPPGPPHPAPRRLAAVLRALAYDVARLPPVFARLAEIPSLGIGQTRFDPGFRRGPIDGASLTLAGALARDLEAGRRRRAAEGMALAASIREATRFEPLLADPPEAGVYPRLALRAPDGASRDAALADLADLGAGASAFYPSALDAIPALAPHAAGDVPRARDLAARLLTLPTHGGLRGARREAALRALARRAPA